MNKVDRLCEAFEPHVLALLDCLEQRSVSDEDGVACLLLSASMEVANCAGCQAEDEASVEMGFALVGQLLKLGPTATAAALARLSVKIPGLMAKGKVVKQAEGLLRGNHE